MRRFWVACLFLPCVVTAQVDTVHVQRWDPLRVVDGAVYTLTAPARWKGKDFVKAGAVVVGTAAISLLDEPVRKFWSGKKADLLDEFQRVGNHYGKPYSAVAVTSGFYFTGLL